MAANLSMHSISEYMSELGTINVQYKLDRHTDRAWSASEIQFSRKIYIFFAKKDLQFILAVMFDDQRPAVEN